MGKSSPGFFHPAMPRDHLTVHPLREIEGGEVEALAQRGGGAV